MNDFPELRVCVCVSVCVCVCVPGGMSMGPWLQFACASGTEEAQQSCNPCICHQEELTPSLNCGGEGRAVWTYSQEKNTGQFWVIFFVFFEQVHIGVKVLTVVNGKRMMRSSVLMERWYGGLS